MTEPDDQRPIGGGALAPDVSSRDYAEFYERVGAGQTEERYYQQHSYALARRQLLLRLLEHRAPRGCLLVDVGCASGYYSVPFAAGSDRRVIGVDISPSSVTLAAERASQAGVADQCTFLVGDVRALPVHDGVADLVLATEVLEHIREQQTALAEFLRVLKPGGRLVVSTPHVLDTAGVSSRWRHRNAPDPEGAGVVVDQLGQSEQLTREGIEHEPYFHDAHTFEQLRDMLPEELVVEELRSLWFRPPLLYRIGRLSPLNRKRRPSPEHDSVSKARVHPDAGPIDFPQSDLEARLVTAWSRAAARVPELNRLGQGVLLVAKKAR